MKKWSLVVITTGLLANAHAEPISVPCTDFVAATGEKLSCQSVQLIQIERVDYEAKKAAHSKNTATTSSAPWSKKANPAEVSDPGLENCDMPPWMKPRSCP